MLLPLALCAALLAAPHPPLRVRASLAAGIAARQQPVRVQASLSAERIRAGETAVLVLGVETGGEAPGEIPVPVLPPGLDLGPISDYSQLQVSFPGGRTRITRREIVLLARDPGRYRIPAVTVEVEGRSYRSQPLELLVLPGTAPPAALGGSAGAIRLRASARPDTVWVGQQLLYQVEALFPEELRVRQARPPAFEPPDATGFWAYDLPDPVTVSLQILDGAAWEVQTFRQVLFPLNAGSFTLSPARMHYELRQGFAFTPERREATSTPTSILVRPLPPPPAGFEGAVGRYRIRADLSADSVQAGAPVTLRFTVEGQGNVKALPRPRLDLPEHIELLPGSEELSIGFADEVVSGRKLMTWTLVASEPGILELPGIAYTWFDPQAGAYQAATTPPQRLTVLPAAGGEVGRALAPLRLQSDVAPLRWTRSPAFAAAQALPVLLLLAAAAFHRARTRRAGGEAARRAAVAREIERIAALLDDPPACLAGLAACLRQLDSPAAAALRQRVQAARYAPDPPSRADCERLLAEARRVAHGPATARAIALPLLLLALLAPGPGATDLTPTAVTAFEAGARAYADGAYAEAAQAFARQLRNEPRDAAAWYDLGNAWQRAGEPGRAAWAWLRALQLRPRDEWARHNLEQAGARAALAQAPALPLSSDELRLAAALAWWVAVLAGVAAWRSRRRIAGALALAAALLLLASGGTLAARQWRAPRALVLQEVTLLAAPVLRADSLAALPPAQPVRLLEERNDWVLVRTADLRDGWVERRALGRL